MKKNFNLLIKQALSFFLVSGIGWLLDMTIYTILSNFIAITISSIISSSVAVSYVYFVSTKKIFENKETFNIKTKYLFYIIYQIIMILTSSFIIGYLNNFILKHISLSFIIKFSKICAKIIITPFTMIINFIFMKFLMEKV